MTFLSNIPKITYLTIFEDACNITIKRNFSAELKTKVNGQIINYLKVGQGDKHVLCFPGALGTIWSDFKPQIEGLDKNKFTIIAFDPPGYGASRPPNRLFNSHFYEKDADSAHDFMQNIKIEKYSLLGWSYGGISSLILAAKYPENVDRLIVWGSYSYVLPEDIEAYEKIRDINQWSEKMRNPLIELYTKDGLQKMWNDWCDAMVDIAKNGGDICKTCLKNIKCPTLILHGDKDPIVIQEHPDYLLGHIKNAKSKDIYLKEYPTEIFLKYTHNHFADALRHRTPSDEVLEKFKKLFQRSFTLFSAAYL